MSSSCVSTFTVSESTFKWTIPHFGLQFDSEDSLLISDELNGVDGSKWRMRARCQRFCPDSLLRVYVRLLNVSESDTPAPNRGRYAIRAFYREEQLETHERLAEEVEDGFARDKLDNIDSDDSLRTLLDLDPDEIFIGWAGSVSENLTRIIHLRIRHFPPTTTSTELQPIVSMPMAVVTEEQWQRAVDIVYERLLLHIRAAIKAKQLEEDNTIKPLEVETASNWDVYAKKVYDKLMGVAKARMVQKPSLDEVEWVRMKPLPWAQQEKTKGVETCV